MNELLNSFLKQNMDDTVLIDKDGEEISRVYFLFLINELTDELKKYNDIKPGEKVVLWGSNSIQNVVTIFSLIFSGLIPILVSDNLNYKKVLEIKSNCRATYIITDKNRYIQDKYLLKVPKEFAKKNILDKKLFQDSTIEKLKNNLVLGSNYFTKTIVILPTSGTTSTSKIVNLSYENIFTAIKKTINKFELNRDTEELLVFPINSITGLICQLFSVLFAGGKVALYDNFFSIASMMKYIYKVKANYLVLTPSVLKNIDVAKEYNKKVLKEISHIVICGENVTKDSWINIFNEFPRIKIFISYGLTELSGAVSNYNVMNWHDDNYVGYVFEDLNVRIINDDDRICEYNEIGEICISGPTVMKGYIDKEETKNRFIGSYFRTGDIGYINRTGLYIIGRKKNIAIIGGKNVCIDNIEKVLRSHNNVKNVRVYYKKSEYTGEMLIADIELKMKNKSDKREIFEFCLDNLEKYMIPKKINFIDSISLNNSLKISRK